ncbi:MAG: hypothetical protein JWQ19_1691 [Subtercola sp.]|nr:hypothetical protein [Subtercola sp.]
MRVSLVSRIAAALVGVLILGGLASCSLFVTPPPPASVAEAATALASTLRQTTGVGEVTVSVGPRDYKDGGSLDNPGAWRISATVTATPSLPDVQAVAAVVENELDRARLIASATATLNLGGDGLPDTTFDFLGGGERVGLTVAQFVDAGIRLRRMTGIHAVHVWFGALQPSVTVTSPRDWLSTIRQLRALDGFGDGLLAAVTLYGQGPEDGGAVDSWMTVDAVSPNDATLAGLTTVITQPGVTSLSYDAFRPADSLDDWRPYLTVETASLSARAAVLSLLTNFDETAAPVAGIPRAAFTVFLMNGGSAPDAHGYLGLALDAAEPADLVPAPQPPPPR